MKKYGVSVMEDMHRSIERLRKLMGKIEKVKMVPGWPGNFTLSNRSNLEPLTHKEFKKNCDYLVSQYRRMHYTGKMLLGLIVPLGDYEFWKNRIDTNPRLRAIAESLMTPEVCCCSNPSKHKTNKKYRR